MIKKVFCALYLFCSLFLGGNALAATVSDIDILDASNYIEQMLSYSRGATPLKYFVDYEWAPYRVYTDKGVFGFEIDINDAIFAESAYVPEFVTGEWSSQNLDETIRKTSARVLGWRAIREPNISALLLTDPVYVYHFGFYSRLDMVNPIVYQNMRLLRVGVVGVGSPFTSFLLAQRGLLNINIYVNSQQALNALLKGDIDLWFDEKMAGSYVINQSGRGGEVFYHAELEESIPIAIALRKGDETLRDYINARIKLLRKNGSFEVIFKKHFGVSSLEYYEAENVRLHRIQLVFFGMGAALLVVVCACLLYAKRISDVENQRAQSEHKTMENRHQYRVAAQTVEEGILFYYSKENHMYFSENCARILGIPDMQEARNLETGLGKFKDALTPKDANALQTMWNGFGKNAFLQGHEEFRLKVEEAARWIYFRAKAYWEERSYRVCGSLEDITERKRMEQEALQYAYYDPITDTYNMRQFCEFAGNVLKHTREEKGSCCLLSFDINHLKAVNEKYGYSEGNRVLRSVALAIYDSFPRNALIGRLDNSDEFFALLPNIAKPNELFGFIAETVTTVSQIPCREIKIATSIGGALFPKDGESLEELIEKAGAAGKFSLKEGRGRLVMTGDF